MRGGGFGLGRMGGIRGNLTEEEKKNSPKMTKGMLKRIFTYLKPYTFQFLIVLVTIVIIQLLGIVPFLLIKRIVDTLTKISVATKDKYLPVLFILIALSFGATVLSNLVNVLEDFFNT